MSRTLHSTGGRSTLTGELAARPKSRMRCAMAGRQTEILADPRFQFDPDAWIALLEEQKQLIACAAGVDPSKVKIQIGH